VTLLAKGPAEVRQEVWRDLEAGIPLIAPECAIPLETRVENLQAIVPAVCDWAASNRP
jgi:[methyl-Co(III) methanol-specific corrinoid protein]:coenzyme M methyltransferase